MSSTLDRPTLAIPLAETSPAPADAVLGDFVAALTTAMSAYAEQLGGILVMPPILNGVSAAVLDTEYTNIQKTDQTPVLLGEFTYCNQSDVTQEMIWKQEKAETASTTVTLTQAIEAGANAGFQVPAIGLGIGVDFKASVSTTLQQNLTVEQKWEWNLPLIVQAHTRLTARAELSMTEYDMDFTAQVRIDGVSTSCAAVVMGPGLKFQTITNSPGGWFTVAPVDGYTPDGTAVEFEVAGTFNGVQGVSVDVLVTTGPCPPVPGAVTGTSVIRNAHLLPRVARVFGLPEG